jgi:hypothetical protein
VTQTGLLLRQAAALLRTVCADWCILALACLLLGTLLLAAQARPLYRVQIGQEDGLGADVPLVARFYGADQAPGGRFRWSGARSLVRLPGFGARPLALQLRVLALTPEIMAARPEPGELWWDGRMIADLPLRLTGASYHVLLPASASPEPVLELRSPTFQAAGDPRRLGMPVSTLVVRPSGWSWLAWQPAGAWLLLALILWLTLRLLGFTARLTLLALGLACALVGLATALDPPRAALAPLPLITAALAGAGLCAVLRWLLPPLACHLGLPLSRRALRWLACLALLAMLLRWGGKLYPGAMEGDVAFHANRFGELLGGRVFLQAPHRGVPSPYAPLFYILLAPFTLLQRDRDQLLVAASALLDALSPALVYAICLLVWPGWRSPAARPALTGAAETRALLAAGLYSLAGGGLMASWWSFGTHIFAQWAFLMLVAGALLIWGGWAGRQARPAQLIGVLGALQLLVLLGHFSFYLNTVLLSGAALACMWLAGRFELRRDRLWLTAGVLLAQLLAAALFYSVYISQLRRQAGSIESATDVSASSSMAALQAYLTSILGDGLTAHMGLFPAALALAGTAMLAMHERRRSGAGLALVAGTWLVALLFFTLPLVSGANLTTRWLMFALWAVCVTAGPAAWRFWRRGAAGRLLCLLIGIYVVWIGAAIWLGALAWRIRPPEPF